VTGREVANQLADLEKRAERAGGRWWCTGCRIRHWGDAEGSDRVREVPAGYEEALRLVDAGKRMSCPAGGETGSFASASEAHEADGG
jgi:hypothetical protein